MTPTPRTDAFTDSLQNYSSSFEIFCERVEVFARTLETELTAVNIEAYMWRHSAETHLKDIAELNLRLIDRQQTLMAQAVKLQAATRILARCRDSAGRMEMGLYEDIQNFLHT